MNETYIEKEINYLLDRTKSNSPEIFVYDKSIGIINNIHNLLKPYIFLEYKKYRCNESIHTYHNSICYINNQLGIFIDKGDILKKSNLWIKTRIKNININHKKVKKIIENNISKNIKSNDMQLLSNVKKYDMCISKTKNIITGMNNINEIIWTPQDKKCIYFNNEYVYNIDTKQLSKITYEMFVTDTLPINLEYNIDATKLKHILYEWSKDDIISILKKKYTDDINIINICQNSHSSGVSTFINLINRTFKTYILTEYTKLPEKYFQNNIYDFIIIDLNNHTNYANNIDFKNIFKTLFITAKYLNNTNYILISNQKIYETIQDTLVFYKGEHLKLSNYISNINFNNTFEYNDILCDEISEYNNELIKLIMD